MRVFISHSSQAQAEAHARTHRKEEEEGQHRRSLHGCLAKYVKRPIPQEEWAEVREQAWAFAIREKEAALAAETGSAARLPPKDEEELRRPWSRSVRASTSRLRICCVS